MLSQIKFVGSPEKVRIVSRIQKPDENEIRIGYGLMHGRDTITIMYEAMDAYKNKC